MAQEATPDNGTNCELLKAESAHGLRAAGRLQKPRPSSMTRSTFARAASTCFAVATKAIRNIVGSRQHRAGERAEAQLAAAATKTFNECASAYIESKKTGWRNAKHVEQWQNTLDTYAGPVFGKLPVQSIDTTLVERVLKPIWASKTETASRVRGRIEAVLDWATVQKYRKGENPARWRGHLDKLLPARSKVRKVEHHPALPYGELPSFLEALRAREGNSVSSRSPEAARA
jgi:hypothetical protein